MLQLVLLEALELMAVSAAMLWVSSEAQLADGLAKPGAQDFFKQFLQGNQQWIARYDPEFIAAKKKKKARLHPEPPSEDCELIPDLSFRDLIKQHKQGSPAKTFWAVWVISPQSVMHFAFDSCM